MAESSNSKELPPNIYKPLDKDTQEIRLFEILPSEDINAAVEIRLFRRRLGDMSGQFMPFSYVWGDPTDTKPIKVNGMSTAVTRNLADFLKQTRASLLDILTKGSWDKPAIFWADAICINQQDMEERNHQVQLLKPIYSSAPLALAWLGHFSDAHLAVSLAESLGPSYDLEPDKGWQGLNYRSWMIENMHLWASSSQRDGYWDAYRSLVRSPYWARTWTLQEMVLPAHVLFMCGSSLVKWRSIMAVQQLLSALLSMACNPSHPTAEAHRDLYRAMGPFHNTLDDSIREINEMRWKMASTSDNPNLNLVPRLVEHRATDPRDKVYGLLGIMETRLEADYVKDTPQVYKEFVSTWINEIKDLNFLLYSQEHDRIARQNQTPLPSWAPDWEGLSMGEGPPRNNRNFGLFMAESFANYDASERLPTSNAHLCDGLTNLAAAGVVPSDMSDTDFALGVLQLVIKCTSCFDSHLGPRIHIFQALFRTIFHYEYTYRIFQNAYGGPQRSVALGFLVCILASATNSVRLDWPRIAATYLWQLGIPLGQDFSRAWREEIFKGYSAESGMMDCEGTVVALERTWENVRGEVEGLISFMRVYLGPSLKFVTNNGYLGISTAAQVGDMVVVLVGCKAPVLLRRRGSHYKHVGPCLVMGLMEGEAGQMVDRGEVKIETFEIR
ncbi:heterokaryon incompatibility protein-domain-containing protein [Fusarium solani]|uniref:Heterokaryon incompatibility protein-domain-containing protein n=1 Tax=Fusarium solani TaxID=169388 RepID=A0A9P9JNX1_FUSSL|nr:heterokaryon incompatibility protein-domain-containing protein [Fusarium solani]KAH7232092.1 heterokaryon incompatibility protein-domain-containing protein [Fusarium solani]